MGEADGAGSITAALVVIGDEVLSGRTKDKNIGHIAERLTDVGIDLREVRIVPDVEEDIVAAVNALRQRFTYVFTTGGIGPTHDDITADSIAAAFGVSIDVDPRARAMLLEYIAEKDLNEARLRMARIPAGASLVVNEVSKAPGFRIGNVIVMAGVPRIMQSMLEAVLPELDKGRPMLSRTILADAREGDIAAPLGEIARAFPEAVIGSYPFRDETDGRFKTNLVVRSREPAVLDAAGDAVARMVEAAAGPG
ncbi:competence/damage-inducible protein A [Xanthobacter dioxanivorans]|uniref:Competence/damage-inducible protein A n=1 Tax=Xanthobacter dioxanivorans TaxID=2528964 RepID=A0A974PKJ2_9HYPH|nr:molybdopterin-binding protein [Xanthobacter dioxanivorans]QRG05073.1 competence/damage-inducible protein A [Xanthobacter dioxanivorans]